MAGRYLGLSPTRVSRAVSQLEASLNIKLAVRSTRRVHLTSAGRRYWHSCQKILKAIHDAEEEARRGSADFRVGCPAGLGRHYVMSAVARMQEVLATHIELCMMPFRMEAPTVGDRCLDLLVTARPAAALRSVVMGEEWEARVLGETPLIICASPKYLERHGTPTHFAELQRHRCLGLAPSEIIDPDAGQDAEAGGIRFAVHINDEDSVVEGIRAQMGVGVVPLYSVSKECQEGRLVHLMPEHNMPSWVVEAHLAPASATDPIVRSWANALCDDLKHQLIQDTASTVSRVNTDMDKWRRKNIQSAVTMGEADIATITKP